MDLLNEALKYFEKGYNIIPVNKNKKPLVSWEKWQKEKQTKEQIEQWWEKYPSANIAVITGKISNLLVIDTDTQEATQKIQELIPESLLVPCQKTPRGGMHFFFTYMDGFSSKPNLLNGIDIKTNGGLITVAPSVSKRGKWQWLDGLSIFETEPPAIPEELTCFLKQGWFKKEKEKERTKEKEKEKKIGTNTKYINNNINNINNNINNTSNNISTLVDITTLVANNTNVSETNLQEKEQVSDFIKEHVLSGLQVSTRSTTVYNAFQEGSRNEDLFHVAYSMLRGGCYKDIALKAVEIIGKNTSPPLGQKEIETIFQSAFKRFERKERNLAEEIRQWLSVYKVSTFCLHDVYTCLQVSTRQEKKSVWIALKRLCDQGVIEKIEDKSGFYKCVSVDSDKIDWLNSDEKSVDIKFPFEIEKIVEIPSKSICVVAGEKDAGKTSFLLNTCLLNLDKTIHYFSSEMSPSELKKRLKKFEVPLEKWKAIDFRERVSDFHDVVYPDDINIIDFLEIYEEFYKIGLFIRKIYDKLNKGICIIAIQKNPGVDWGLGGQRSLEKARLYLSISKGGILKIISGKNWASDLRPDGLQIDFKLIQGAKFIKISDNWYREKT